jgi:DNA repair protein RAD16
MKRSKRQSAIQAQKLILIDSEQLDDDDEEFIIESDDTVTDTDENQEPEQPIQETNQDLSETIETDIISTELEPAIQSNQVATTMRKRHVPKAKAPKIDFYDLNPDLKDIWKDVDVNANSEIELQPQPKNLLVKLLPFQLDGLSWMVQQELNSYKGGILADEMGMVLDF